MEDESKLKGQLILELEEARKRIAELEEYAAECRLTEKALCKSNEMLEAALATARMAYWDWNRNTGRKIASDSASHVFGLLHTETFERSSEGFKLVHPDDVERYSALVHQAVERGESWHCEFRIIRPCDGRTAWLEERATAKRDPQTGEIHLTGLAWDITEHKLTEQALRMSEERYRILAENAQDVIWAVDPDFHFTYVSPSSVKMFGYTPEEIMSQPFASAYTKESCERIMESLSQAMVWIKEGEVPEEKKNSILEAQRYRKDGSTIWVEITTSGLFNEEGKLVSIVGVTRNISERKKVEEELQKYREHLEEIVKERMIELDVRNTQLEKEVAERKRAECSLRESEALYRLLATNASDIIFTLDMDLRFTFISPSISRIRGFSVEEAMAQTPSEALTPASLEVAMKVFQEEFDGELKDSKDMFKTHTLELEETCKDGSTVWTETTFSVLCDDRNNLTGILGITRDISERKQAEEEKKKLEDKLLHAQKIEALDRFAGGIAHDLNNILSPIIINIEGLLDDEPHDSIRYEILEETLRAAYRQRDLVKKILAFGRRSEQIMKPVHMVPLLEESLAFLRSSLPSTIEIQKYFEVKSDTIIGDPIQIQQVIMNLCRNAADALEGHRGAIEVSLKNSYIKSKRDYMGIQKGEYLELTVRDTGVGMGSDVKERIFDPFFTTKGVGKGTGLGLSIAHGIVKSHAGAIIAKSHVGKGSLLKVYLPLSKARPQAQAFYDNHTPSEFSRRKILLVDDEEIILSSLQRTLKTAGYQVIPSRNGPEALNLFSRKPDEIDLVITDLTMPEMIGLDLAGELLKVRPDIPIILCTGFNDIINQKDVESYGISELLLKPVGAGELKKAIQRVLGV